MNEEGIVAEADARTVDLVEPSPRQQHPWFLVSGLLMFVGCYLVSAAVRERPDEVGPVLGLVGVLVVYEWLVLATAFWLWRKTATDTSAEDNSGGGGAGREAGQLLGLAVVLLADTTFVYNELAIAHLGWGAAAAGLGVAMGVVKLIWIARWAKIELGLAGWLVAGAGLLMVFGLPVTARGFGSSGGLPGWVLTAGWWMAAGLLARALLTLSDSRWRHAEQGRGRVLRGRIFRGLMVGLPTGSAVVHLLATHWVYHEAWTAAHVSPVLLGLSVVLLMRTGWGSTRMRLIAGASGVVGALASMTGEVALIRLGGDTFIAWSAMRGWLLTAGVLYAWVWWRRRSLVLLLVWPTLGAAGSIGASPEMVIDRVSGALERSWHAVEAWVPTGLLAWGLVVMGLAFATLGWGAWVSGRRE